MLQKTRFAVVTIVGVVLSPIAFGDTEFSPPPGGNVSLTLEKLRETWRHEAFQNRNESRQSGRRAKGEIVREFIYPETPQDFMKVGPTRRVSAGDLFAGISLTEPMPVPSTAFLPVLDFTRAAPAPLAGANVAGESAPGFPGEVIDEVIVPVPSEIFLVLDKLGKPDWKSELRKNKPPTFSGRVDVSLLLGAVVAEGFIAVQAQDQDAVERIGKDVLKLSESLGLKDTVLPHTNSILEAAKHNHWEIVRVEFDKTQKTARDTMEQRRDYELSQCVSLGGWLRGTEAVTSLIGRNYTSDAAELLNQPDIVRHFRKELQKISNRSSKLEGVRSGLNEIARVIGTGDEPPSVAGIESIHSASARVVKIISTAQFKPVRK
ncbi:MAG: hypothetical protein ACR2OZ_08365 [Verrucomicrobiales bacterium]